MGTSTEVGSKIAFSLRSSFVRALFLSVFCFAALIYTFRRPPSSVAHEDKFETYVSHSSNMTQRHYDFALDAERLRSLQQRYDLGNNIEYGLRYIRFHRRDIERKSITKIDDELFPRGFEVIDIRNPPPAAASLKPFEVSVPLSPFPKTVDASELLFGISTTYQRLVEPETSPIREWAHWLTDGHGRSNGAGLILRLVDASPDELEQATQQMRSIGIDVKVHPADSSVEMAKRYLSLLPELYNDSSRGSRKFLAMCDDDTFFPSMHALLKRLAEFDHKVDLYLGTLSEDINNVQRHGSQAFGGAGVFFSLSLAHKIAHHFEECSTQDKIDEANTGWGPQGDVLLRRCISDHTEVTLTMIRELHQLDIMGDPAGFYEAGLVPLSLHHFKGGMWHRAYPYDGAQVMHNCGEACFLERFRTSDDFIISNGFSVAYYLNGIEFNLNQVERTFGAAPDDYGWNLDFMFGPQRKNLLWTGRKVAWELKESTIQTDGSIRQTYIRKADDYRWIYGEGGPRMFDNDGVLELIWTS